MNNQIIKNFFTLEEVNKIEHYINTKVKTSPMFYLQPELGRQYASIAERFMVDCIGGFPQDILDKLTNFTETFFGVSNLQIFDIIMIRYSNEFGLIPHLPEHKDNGVIKKYTIDYQHNGNIDWPLLIDGKEYLLENNDIVTFLGSNQMHGRPDRIFKDKEYLENIFFQFIEKREK